MNRSADGLKPGMLQHVPERTVPTSLFDSAGWLRAWEQVTVEQHLRRGYLTTAQDEVLPIYQTTNSPFWFGYEAQSEVVPLSDRPIVFVGSTYSMYTRRGPVPAELVRAAHDAGLSWLDGEGLLVVPNLTEEGVACWIAEAGEPVGRVLLDRTYHGGLSGTFEDHLRRLPKKLRKDIERRIRRAQERGLTVRFLTGEAAVRMVPAALPLTVGTTDEHDWPPLYDEVTLDALLGVPGSVLAVAEADGELVGAFFGFVHGSEAVFLCGGVDYLRLRDLSSYVVLMYACVEWAYEQGLRHIEWGRDNYTFKQRHELTGTDLWALVYSPNPAPDLASRLQHMDRMLHDYIERG